MPGGTQIAIGNESIDQIVYLPTVTVPNLPASSTVSQLITVPGVLPGDLISWNQLSYVVGIAVENIWVSAASTLTMIWCNDTAGAINGTAAQPFLMEIIRPDRSSFGVTSLPNGLY